MVSFIDLLSRSLSTLADFYPLSMLAEPLTEEEQKEKEELSPQGFSNWNKRDFQLFCRGTEIYGRDDYEGIAHEVQTKSVDQVREYATVFWERSHELEGESSQIISSFRCEQARD